MVSSTIFIFLCVTLSTSNSFKTPEYFAVNDEKSLSINVNDESSLYPAVSDESSLSFEWTGPMSMRVRNRDGDEDDIELRPAQGIGNVHVECLFVGYLVKDTTGSAGVVGCQQSIEVDITIVSIYSPGTMFIFFNENKTTLELLDTPAINDDSDSEEEEFKRSKRSSFYEDGDTYVYDDDDDDKLDYDDGNGTDYVYTDGDFAYDGAKTPKSIPPSVYYEFALSYDEAFLTKMNQNTTEAEKYITIVATLAQTYFKHSSLGTIIHFVRNKNIRYLRGKEFMIDPLSLSEKLNITDAIKDITSKEPLIIFTKTDDSEFWRGIASMRRACSATLGRAIIKHRKEFLRAAITMAHEMGHLFGNFHDGIADERNARSKKRNNTSCRGTGIMSESDNRPEVWSVCSHQRLAKWFKNTGHACLKTASACDNDVWVKDVPCSCGVGNQQNLCSILNEGYCVNETATCLGTIRTSTNFPNNYPHNEDTEQTMSVTEGFSVLVTFVDFQIEDKGCRYDYVQICDQNKNCGRKLCGSSLPDPVTTLTSTATVVFHSDGSVSGKGFRLFYQKTVRKDSFWSEWSQWSSCSRTCGGGSQTRRRSCSNLGNCKESSTADRKCSTDSCPRVWREWSQWSSCSRTCGRGSQTRRRSCTIRNSCQGESLKFRMCSSFSSCSRVWCWNKLRKRCIPGRRRSYSSGGCYSSENECKQLQEWSGIQTKIWGDDQCKNLGQGTVGLEECMAICVKTPTCTAINYNRYKMHCVLRECTQHLRTPQLQSDNYRGYYYLKRKRNACGRQLCIVGRPFFVDGKSRTTISQAFHDGPSKLDESWKVGNFPSVLTNNRYNEEIGHYWLHHAEAEHASVASFARHTLQLMSMGAPARLLEASQQAGIDEIKHAKICYGLATAFIGADITPGVLDVSGSLDSMGIKEIIRSVIIDGCIGETLSAIEAHFAAYISKDISVKAALTEIATDETRHGQLAWDTIQWIVEKFPEHRIFIEETFEVALGQELMPARDDTQLLPATSLCEDSGRDTVSYWYGPDMMAVINDTDSLHTRAFCQDSEKDDFFHWFGLLVAGDRDRVRRVGIRDVIQPVYRRGFKHVAHISKKIIQLDLAKI